MDRVDLKQAKNYWERRGQLRRADVNGIVVEWYSAPQSIFPSLIDYAWVAVDGEDSVIAISDSLPESYQRFWAYHELIESRDSGEGKCLRALERELLSIPEGERAEYLQRRTNFFKNLIKFHENNNAPQEFLKEFGQSLRHLEKLIEGELNA